MSCNEWVVSVCFLKGKVSFFMLMLLDSLFAWVQSKNQVREKNSCSTDSKTKLVLYLKIGKFFPFVGKNTQMTADTHCVSLETPAADWVLISRAAADLAFLLPPSFFY